MDNDSQSVEDTGSRVGETPLGGREFRGSVEHRDPLAPQLTPAPEGIPEKFWDPIEGKLRQDDLIRSYSELEKKIGQPKEAAKEEVEEAPEDKAPEAGEEDKPEDKGDEEEKPEGEGEEEEAQEAVLTEAIEAAQAAYAETGELSQEAREPLLKAGITNEQIDFYIQGVKATEAAIATTAATAAGSMEELEAAMAWAASAESGWTDKRRVAFNSQMGDPETVKVAVPLLMAEYRKANPSEGKFLNPDPSVVKGDVYGHMDEFQRDLREADTLRDPIKRRAAIAKLRRSRQAGTIKSNRRQPFGG